MKIHISSIIQRHIPFALLLIITLSCVNSQDNISEIIQVEGGEISGLLHEESGIRVFKGIPYAAPPVGDLRWKAPQEVVPWEGVKKCIAFGPSPMQAKPAAFMFWSSEFLIPEEPISEDCLYLNVWTNAKKKSDKRPVLVYIYGGGFRSGGSGCPIYDGAAMAQKDVIFVSINYRVGVFGFLTHPELTQESDNHTSGNYALLDMIAALRWVNRNIEEFGGDPNNVTIAGQSAGSFGVNYLTVSPLAKGLFHKAIAQSGAGFQMSPLRSNIDLRSAENTGLDYAEKFGAEDIDDLRAKSADEIFAVQWEISGPVIDGYVIPESIMDAYQNNQQNDVPVILGWNKDDRVMGTAQLADQFIDRVNNQFGDFAEDFFKVYPVGSEEEATQSQYDMSRDQTFGVQMYTWAKVQSALNGSSVYMYNFNRALPAYSKETEFGAFHSGEIVYAYDNLLTLDRPWEPSDHDIADLMSGYWANFAKTGNPNGEGLPRWDAYTPDQEMVMTIDVISEQKRLPDKEKLDFWIRYFDSLK
jgi:para-nitrobenzyl esterase